MGRLADEGAFCRGCLSNQMVHDLSVFSDTIDQPKKQPVSEPWTEKIHINQEYIIRDYEQYLVVFQGFASLDNQREDHRRDTKMYVEGIHAFLASFHFRCNRGSLIPPTIPNVKQ